MWQGKRDTLFQVILYDVNQSEIVFLLFLFWNRWTNIKYNLLQRITKYFVVYGKIKQNICIDFFLMFLFYCFQCFNQNKYTSMMVVLKDILVDITPIQ